MKVSSLTKFLYCSSFLYLILPYLIFIGGWIRQPFSSVFILLILLGIFSAIKSILAAYTVDDDVDETFSPGSLVLVLLAIVPFALIAGAGGWGPQDSDWLKHNAILRDLITESWPVIYNINDKPVMLTYYTAYQLPAAVIGKLFGWQAANHALFLYTLIGLFLSALWVWVLTGAKKWWVIVVFLVFSGMDIIGLVLFKMHYGTSMTDAINVLIEKISSFSHIEWWAGWGFAQFSSMASLIVWVPNQGISGWLLISLILSDGRLKNLHYTGILYLGLSSLWSPFVSLGLLPFIVAIMLYQWRDRHYSIHFLRQTLSLANISGLVLGLLIVFYLAGRFQEFELPMDVSSVYKEGITWTFLRLPNMFVLKYLLFIFLEFAAIHGLLYSYLFLQTRKPFDNLRRLLMLSTVILLLLPFLNWGWNNEPAMRTSIPALFITVLVSLYVLSDNLPDWRAVWIRRVLTCVLLVGSFTVVMEYGRHVSGIYQQASLVRVPPEHEVSTLFELQERKYKNYYSFIGQYLGSSESLFLKYLGKE